MNNFSKSQIGRDTCKSHSARSDRAELYRICPSKLSKRELEDLYFALLEDNLELKRTLNGQEDKIKILSTKVQRMTATQKNAQSKETKECCVATKAIVCEQKASIADLKLANERMSERIRLLTMRLCSAKQFLRRSPCGLQSTSRCNRCSTAPPASLKNSSTSALPTKVSEDNLKPSASCQCLDKDACVACVSTRSVETETPEAAKPASDRQCDENKCRTQMEELEQKIFNLEEELSNTHEEYSNRISRLEREVLDVRKENVQVRSEKIASEHQLQHLTRRSSDLVTNLRAAETNRNELKMQLSIEKRKNAELEMQLKAANMSNNVAKIIEERPTSVSNATHTHTQLVNDTKQVCDEITPPKFSDDSGYVDANKSHDFVDDKGLNRLNANLIRKISDLESKLDCLKVSTATQLPQDDRRGTSLDKDLHGFNVKEIDDGVRTAENKYNDVLKEFEKTVTIAKNKAEDPVNVGSKTNALVINSNEIISITPLGKSLDTTIPWQDTPSTSKDVNEYLDKYNSPEKEISPVNNTKLYNSTPDQHNKFQIPGPIHSSSSNGKVRNKNLLKRLSIEVKTKSTGRNSSRQDSIHENQSSDHTNKLTEECIGRTSKSSDLNVSGTKGKTNMSGLTNKSTKTSNSECRSDVRAQTHADFESIFDGTNKDEGSEKNYDSKESPLRCSLKKDSLEVSHVRLHKESETKDSEQIPKCTSNLLPAKGSEHGASVDDISQLEFCASHSRVCTCPSAKHRAVSMFRTCSGTLRFTTTSDAAKFRTCDCSIQHSSNESCTVPNVTGGTQVDHPDIPQARRRSSTSDRGTYSIRPLSEVVKFSRGTSPDNTDCEISHMTDLPSERDGKSPRPPVSPGEDKATTTNTDSYTTPITTDYGSLSEGELPARSTVRRVSIGEQTNTNHAAPVESSTQKMEAALQAISDELARCKQLLLSQRPQEPPRRESRDAASTAQAPAPGCARPIALRRAPASPRISGARAPKCVFTLHIGTVVLADEAVLNSRNSALMLTWQFYDQNVTMTRMRPGRVVLFDFSTEYDIQPTDDFLHYMKHEEMPIKICVLDMQDKPFASCALPLREALLHANKRTDMSLTLVAGPAAAAAAPDPGDELGVLDLWCLLRVEPALASAINQALATPSVHTSSKSTATPNTVNNKRMLEQVVESEMLMENPMPQDLNQTLTKRRTSRHQSITRRDSQNVSQNVSEFLRGASVQSSTQMEPGGLAAAAVAALDAGSQYDASKYPALRSRSEHESPEQNLPQGAAPESWSGIIIDEVAASIKSPYDMKQALERNSNQDSVISMSRLAKNYDDLTSLQTPSIKPIFAKLLKLRHAPKKGKGLLRDLDIIGNRRRTSQLIAQDLPPQKSYTEDENNTETYKEYDNMANTIGSMKPETLKKSVKIYPDYEESSAEEPQKDVEDDERYLTITVLWLALNEECEAMLNPRVQRLFVAYSFLGRGGAELETPVSLPKPKNYIDKCHFNFKKTFKLADADLPLLGHMARCRATSKNVDSRDCIVFTVVSEPPEDPLGLENCEDIGYAYLWLGDLVACSAGSAEYTEVVPVRAAGGGGGVCGVLAVAVAGLDVLRRCLLLAHAHRDSSTEIWSTF